MTERYKYLEYANGDRQLFDLDADPYELMNLADDPGSAAIRTQVSATLEGLRGPPPIDTTIVTGPTGTMHQRAAEFTFFSASRFATHRCRLVRNGVEDPWHDCSGGSDVVGSLADGAYVFEVAGTDETGATESDSGLPRLPGDDVERTGRDDRGRARGRAALPQRNVRIREHGAGRCVPVPDGGVGAAGHVGVVRLGRRVVHGPSRRRVAIRRPRDRSRERSTLATAGYAVRPGGHDRARVPVRAPPLPRDLVQGDDPCVVVPREATMGPWMCSLDGVPATDCSDRRVRLAHISGGSHTVAVSGRDLLGNTRSTLITWLVDRTSPTLTIASGPPALSNIATATFQLHADSWPQTFSCVVDALPEMPCSETWKVPALGNGRHVLTAWSYDMSMNRSDPRTWSWRVDTIRPVVTITGGPAQGSTTTSRTASFTFTSSLSGGFRCSLDGGTFTRSGRRSRSSGSATTRSGVRARPRRQRLHREIPELARRRLGRSRWS